MDAREAIRAFVKDLLASKGETAAFEDAASLLLSGSLQSIDAVEIALFLEQEYAIDFSVVGFDDIWLAKLTEPPLTTVMIPRAEIGAAAVEAVLQNNGEADSPGHEVLIPTHLLVRRSTGAAPAD